MLRYVLAVAILVAAVSEAKTRVRIGPKSRLYDLDPLLVVAVICFFQSVTGTRGGNLDSSLT